LNKFFLFREIQIRSIFLYSRITKAVELIYLQIIWIINSFINSISGKIHDYQEIDLGKIPVYVVTISDRKNSWESSKKQIRRMGFNKPVKFDAVIDSIGERGAAKSQLAIIQEFMISSFDLVLICEDDIKFIGKVSELNNVISDFINCSSAEVLCLANYVILRESNFSRYLDRALDVQTRSCFLIKKSFAKYLIESDLESIELLTQTNGLTGKPDKVWKKLQKNHIFVVPKKRICIQRSGYSTIQKKWIWHTS
jgi:hypothetical protein